MQLGILILESWIAMTRVSDYYHHMTDVIFGFLLGTIIGVLGGMHTTKWLNTALCGAEEICDSEISEKNDPVCSSYDDPKSFNKTKSLEHESFIRKTAGMNELGDSDCLK